MSTLPASRYSYVPFPAGTSPSRRFRAFGLVVLVALGALGLSGCGNASINGSAFCRDLSALTELTVSRSVRPGASVTFTFPGRVVITRRAVVVGLAGDACALKPFPSGEFHCPADFGVTYELIYLAGRRGAATLEADPSGCPSLRGLGTVLSPTNRFWTDLATAMGLHPGQGACNPLFGSTVEAVCG